MDLVFMACAFQLQRPMAQRPTRSNVFVFIVVCFLWLTIGITDTSRELIHSPKLQSQTYLSIEI